MSCGPVPTTFRILDTHAGWERDLAAPPIDVVIGDAIELAVVGGPGGVAPAAVDARLWPPRLARGCGPCDLYLATSGERCTAGVWALVGDRWWPVAGGRGCRLALLRPVAIAAAGDRIAVRDGATANIHVLTARGERVVQSATLAGNGPIALERSGVLWVVADDSVTVVGFDRSGTQRRVLAPAPGPIDRIAVDADGRVWIARVTGRTAAALHRVTRYAVEWFDPAAGAWVSATAAGLADAFPATGLVANDPARGFCVARGPGGAAPVARCFNWCGQPLEKPLPPSEPLPRRDVGTIGFGPIDSGRPRCRWYRVRIDAELPPATRLEVAVATLDEIGAVGHEPWPIDDNVDWQVVGDALDFLIDRAPGRYLHLRLRLHGRSGATPIVRRLRVDLPTSTSAELLPGVYREPEAAPAFLDQFLGLFDATVEDLDRAIDRFPALLDVETTPAEALPWLASLLDLSLDPSWAPERRRALLAALPELYRRRGTVEGLRRSIALATGVSPAIEEFGAAIAFAAVGDARIGAVRLFGRGRTRVRLGTSRLGATRLDSYGDPDGDARRAFAYRIIVQVPARAGFETAAGRARLERLVDSQKPAHVVATIRVGNRVSLVGAATAVGIDTVLGSLPAPVLGADGNVRLGRASVLWPGAQRAGAVLSVDRNAAVGIHTLLS